jgi:hypothetical protein
MGKLKESYKIISYSIYLPYQTQTSYPKPVILNVIFLF